MSGILASFLRCLVILPGKDDEAFTLDGARLQKQRMCDRVATFRTDVVLRLACEDCPGIMLIGLS